jgi:hypothetical protein
MTDQALVAVAQDPIALTQLIADRTLRLLINSRLVDDRPRVTPVFFAWPRGNRAVLTFDAMEIKNPRAILKGRFPDHLSAVLDNRPVLTSDRAGLVVQVGFQPVAVHELKSHQLNLDQQLSPYHVPLGLTIKGPLWLDIIDIDSALIAGMRRMGKTNLVHGWIQALQHGRSVMLYLWDGKNGNEFGRYTVDGDTHLIGQHDLLSALQSIEAEMQARMEKFGAIGVTKLAHYNERATEPLRPLIIVVDELQAVDAEADSSAITAKLTHLIGLGGAYGIHPVLATQRPDSTVVKGVFKSNLQTRISLPVISSTDSLITLGRVGAEKITKEIGRICLVWKGRLVEAQAYLAPLADTIAPAIKPERNVTESKDSLPPEVSALAARCWNENSGKFTLSWLQQIGRGQQESKRIQRGWSASGWIEQDKTQANAWVVSWSVRQRVGLGILTADQPTQPTQPAQPTALNNADEPDQPPDQPTNRLTNRPTA